ncbi:hypothetical protein [Microlunatus sp. Gsoil 973]|uniref:hypothetical protein n=1 Tax=Microlunatus sp. Gsoil 973 TaxID=2672569 RepID=UPI0012B4DB39|nr:hypothetical protein [Microlunatus sp. Gsoil 973]QGN34891.1 hypothetical protein GJV80_21040 [Microlunatus sp. Gsoil 973]
MNDSEGARGKFLGRISEEVGEPVRDDVFRQIRQRENANRYWDGLGGVDGAARAETEAIVQRFGHWLEDQLEPWLASIYPVLDADVWVGDRDQSGGAVDTLLLADALGLHAYSWNMHVEETPFRRLDVVAGADASLVVLGETYSQSVPAVA